MLLLKYSTRKYLQHVTTNVRRLGKGILLSSPQIYNTFRQNSFASLTAMARPDKHEDKDLQAAEKPNSCRTHVNTD